MLPQKRQGFQGKVLGTESGADISTVDSSVLLNVIQTALTTKINDHELYMKGIDYSHYYEENN